MTQVGDYTLIEYQGMWFLTDADGRAVSTILDMGGGVWRARTPGGEARTFELPGGVDDPPRWVAEQITDETAVATQCTASCRKCSSQCFMPAGHGAAHSCTAHFLD